MLHFNTPLSSYLVWGSSDVAVFTDGNGDCVVMNFAVSTVKLPTIVAGFLVNVSIVFVFVIDSGVVVICCIVGVCCTPIVVDNKLILVMMLLVARPLSGVDVRLAAKSMGVLLRSSVAANLAGVLSNTIMKLDSTMLTLVMSYQHKNILVAIAT